MSAWYTMMALADADDRKRDTKSVTTELFEYSDPTAGGRGGHVVEYDHPSLVTKDDLASRVKISARSIFSLQEMLDFVALTAPTDLGEGLNR